MKFLANAVLSMMCSSSMAFRAFRVSRIERRPSVSSFGLPVVAALSSSSADRPTENLMEEKPNSSLSSTTPQNDEEDANWSPWTDPGLEVRASGRQTFRARQHVNPLASKFQQPTVLSPDWPTDVFRDSNRPLFLDIGCSRGGFLVDIASQRPEDYNYLGLEIRPIVVHQAKTRVSKHGLEGFLDFVGCNANVDLDRLLTIADAQGKLEMVTIQFPDPHFKARHAKRRVVTPELVLSLAKFMPTGATIFLQSDIQSVLDDMRAQVRQQPDLFTDDVENVDEYLDENIFGVPTEREVSVLEKGLPVFRTTFKRTNNKVTAEHETSC